jgi:hypothetical protein
MPFVEAEWDKADTGGGVQPTMEDRWEQAFVIGWVWRPLAEGGGAEFFVLLRQIGRRQTQREG